MPSSQAQATHGVGGERSAASTESTPSRTSSSAPACQRRNHMVSPARVESTSATVTDVPSAA